MIVILAILMLGFAAPAAPPPAASLHGVVSSVDGNVVHLANGLIAVDASHAKIEWNGHPAALATVTKGSRIDATLDGNSFPAKAVLPATRIIVAKITDLTLMGWVTAVDAEHATLTLLGQTVHVDAQTNFDPLLKRFANVHAKQIVTVDANRSGERLVAVRLEGDSTPPDVLGMENLAGIVGVVSSIEGKSLRLDGGRITVDASAATNIAATALFDMTSLKPGGRVLANLQANAVGPNKPLPALSLQVDDTPDVSMSGMVTAVDAEHGTFTLLGRTIRIDPRTVFYSSLTAAGIEPRQLFNVTANRRGSELVAVTIGRWIPELD